MSSSRFGTAPGLTGFGGISHQVGQSLAGLFGAGTGRRSNLGNGSNFTPRQARNVTQIGGYFPISSQSSFDRYFQSRLGRASSLPSFESMRVNKGGGQVGGINSAVGNSGYAVDDANTEVARASATYGVPASFLKAIITRESSGDWARDGSRLVNLRNDTILPYVGIFNSAWQSWGCPGDVYSAAGNKQAQIDCLARGMRILYDSASKKMGGNANWDNVAAYHFSGNPDPNNSFCDENGMCTPEYVAAFRADMARFEQAGGSAPGANLPDSSLGYGSGLSSSAGISTVWGNTGETPDLSYGFNAPNNLGLYGYGTEYGMDGNGHTGIDIPMALGSAAYTPVGGVVTCACTGNGPGTGGSGCAAYNDVVGGGCGRIEIQMDNGHTVIMGHMSGSNVSVGQRVSVGQQVGTVGGMNGSHVHLEYRVPDPSTNSGWRIVDPAQALGGAGVSGFPGAPSGPGSTYGAAQPDKWAALGINMNSSYGFGGGRKPQRFMSDWRR